MKAKCSNRSQTFWGELVEERVRRENSFSLYLWKPLIKREKGKGNHHLLYTMRESDGGQTVFICRTVQQTIIMEVINALWIGNDIQSLQVIFKSFT